MNDTLTSPPGHATAPTTGTVARGRLEAIDMARFLAIIGMVAAHVALIPIPGLSLAVDGPPAALFAILGGASAVLATRGKVARHGRWGAAGSLWARGAVLIAVGVLLEVVPAPVTIVLVPFGVTLLLLPAFLQMRSKHLLVAISVLALAGPLANHAVRDALSLDTLGELSFVSPAAFLHSVLFTGTYPVVTWLTYALIGVVTIRALLRAQERGTMRALGRRLLWWGLAAAALAGAISLVQVQLSLVPRLEDQGFSPLTTHLFAMMPSFGGPLGGGLDAVLIASPHSGSTGDIVRTTGLALALVGFLVARGAVKGASTSVLARAARAAGGAPLTLYVLHVLVLGLLWWAAPAPGGEAGSAWWLTGPGAFALQLLMVAAVGSVLLRTGRRGPLEAGMSTLATAGAAAVNQRSRRG